MRGGRGGGSAGRDFDRRGGDRDFDRRGGGREMRGGGGRDLPQRGGGRDGHFTRGDMGPPARSRYENGGGSMRGGGGGAPMPPPPDRDPMYERELVMRGCNNTLLILFHSVRFNNRSAAPRTFTTRI